MKWDSMPLWPATIPLSIGFLLACLFGIIENSSSLFKPMICLLASSFLLYFSPPRIGSRKRIDWWLFYINIIWDITSIDIFVWFIIIILFWISQTTYVWKHNFPTFRIGIWIGLGSCTGLFLGSFYAHYSLLFIPKT